MIDTTVCLSYTHPARALRAEDTEREGERERKTARERRGGSQVAWLDCMYVS
jgi:hypothetical protein